MINTNYSALEAYRQQSSTSNKASGGESFIETAFDTFIDTINPLQHLPIVGSIYRGLTGDDINPVARMAGGGLFGGIPGFLSGLASGLFEYASGDSLENTVMAAFEDNPETGKETQVASNGAVVFGNRLSNDADASPTIAVSGDAYTSQRAQNALNAYLGAMTLKVG
jgi:hypothetical protein